MLLSLLKKKTHYYLKQYLNGEAKNKEEAKIKTRIFKDTEKETWNSFKKDNQTLGQFLELVISFKEFLEKVWNLKAIKNINNLNVEAMQCLVEEIFPTLVLLRKGQDKLFSYLKPYHFHAIDSDPNVDSKDNTVANSLEDFNPKTDTNCLLQLHYPGKEIGDIEKVLKERIEKKIYGTKQKEIQLKYPKTPDTSLNNTINGYINDIEKYIYSIQQRHIKVPSHLTEINNEQQ